MSEQAAKPLPNPFLEVGGTRFEIVPRMQGAFGDPTCSRTRCCAGF